MYIAFPRLRFREVVKVLLDAGSDKEVNKLDGGTLLLVASQAGNFEVAKVLLDAGLTKKHRRQTNKLRFTSPPEKDILRW